jgi:hypothetical protein
MIDDENEAYQLIESLKQHLPMRAFATSPLVQSLRGQGTDIQVNDAVQIDSVLYLGDEGGVACSIGLQGGKTVVVVSITQLQFDSDHPLTKRIQAYQWRRSQCLVSLGNRGSRRPRASSSTKVKGQKVRAATKQVGKKSDVKQRFRTAEEFWVFGEYKLAAESFREVLALDRKDPHFSRYWLASCLFHLGSYDELDKLLLEHDDSSGVWRFAQTLEAFRRHGDTDDTQRLLVEADYLEPEFEDYLLRDKTFDASRQVRFDAGDAERAFGCARLFLPAWRKVPGAATWARRVLKVPTASADKDNVLRRYPRDELLALPMRRETWQVGLLQQTGESNDENTPIWLFGVANVDGKEMRAITVIDKPLTETVVWNELIQSFISPVDGAPARPSNLFVCDRDFCNAWKPLLSAIGVRCRYKKNPQPVGALLEEMGRKLEQRGLPPAEDVDIRDFPQTDAVWQADFIRSPAWVENEQEGSYRPWSMLALEKSRSIALAITHAPGDPAPEMLLEFLVRTMARPNSQPAQRPRLVEVTDSDCYEHLRPRLEAAGIACRLVDELSEFNDFCLRLARSFDGSEKSALADGLGVTPAHMESFYEAAAYFFKQAPWSRVPGEVPIEIKCDNPNMGTRYAIVLGRTGIQLGLCIYDDWETTRAMLAGFVAPDGYRALAVCYDEAQIMSAVDLLLIERLGWAIATPEAWPATMRLEPRRTPRSASAEELVFLDACLRAIPDFIKEGSTSQTRKVETGTRAVELHLAVRL